MWAFITAVLGFLGGLLSFAAGLRLNRTGLRQRLRIWRLRREFANAHAREDKDAVQKLEHLLEELKLYSPVMTHQATAISYFAALNNERSFDVLAERLATPPVLSVATRRLLIWALKDLALSLNENAQQA